MEAAMRITGLALMLAAIVMFSAPARAADPPKPPKTYFVGNSLTDHFLADKRSYNPNGPAIVRISRLAGIDHWDYGAQNIAGAPLWWLWYNPKDGGRGRHGIYEALAKEQWDALSLQPHGGTRLEYSGSRDEKLKTGVVIPKGAPRGDVDMATNYIKKALQNPANKDIQVYIYSTWVRFPREVREQLKKGEKVDVDYAKLWLARSDPPRMYTQQYFEALVAALNEKRKGELSALEKPVRMIPMGDVLLALDRRLKAGELADLDPKTDWKNINDAFQPGLGIHVNPLGQVIVSYVFYGTLCARSPVGLDMRSLMHEPTETPWSLSDEQNRIIQETAWQVVSTHPLAGVKERLEAEAAD
jgi:hypothetical protein